jgi:hypothetical protein
MRHASAALAALTLSAAIPAMAASTPPPGSPVRRAIFDAMRPSVEAKVGPNVEFVSTHFLIEGDWAFVQAEPQRKGGKAINGKAYFPNDWEFMDGLTTTAVLQYRNGRWNLIDSAIGATDAWYCGVKQVSFIPWC